MKVAIPTEGNSWDDRVHQSFSDAPCFFIVDDRRAQVRVLDNPTLRSRDRTGKDIVTVLAGMGVQLVIADQCDHSNAEQLQAAGIRLMMGVQGTVDLVYRRFYHGLLGNPCEPWAQVPVGSQGPSSEEIVTR